MSTLLSWSSGKDSAMALHLCRQENPTTELTLFCTVSEQTRRVGLHGLHESVLIAQAQCLELPLEIVYVPDAPSMEAYEAVLQSFLMRCKADGAEEVVFGDIHLRDLREYRESLVERTGLRSRFPLWGKTSNFWLDYFERNGFSALVLAVQSDTVPAELLGGWYGKDWVNQLAANVDICGENGEFHTLCTNSPDFRRELRVVAGETHLASYTQGARASSMRFLSLTLPN